MAKTPTTSAPETDAATTGLPADDYKTEQEKGASNPKSEPVEPVKAETVNIEPNQPYPSGGAKAEQGVPHNQVSGDGKSGKDQ